MTGGNNKVGTAITKTSMRLRSQLHHSQQGVRRSRRSGIREIGDVDYARSLGTGVEGAGSRHARVCLRIDTGGIVAHVVIISDLPDLCCARGVDCPNRQRAGCGQIVGSWDETRCRLILSTKPLLRGGG